MKSINLSLILLAMIAIPACRRKDPSSDRRDSMADRIVFAKDGDKKLEAAIESAKSELPLFWDRFMHPHPGDESFSVKVPIVDPYGSEYFFLADIQKKGDSISGVIDSEPQIVKSVKVNQRIEVPINQVVDWLFFSNGKMKGNFTSRALINDIPKGDRDVLLRLFDPNPSLRGGA